MRISGGRARGITLKVPKGDTVRPATDGLRQALFSSLAGRIQGATFVDLCAGSGAYGLEALSRGAQGGFAIEKSPKALACLRENIAAVARSCGVPEEVVTLGACDLRQWRPPGGFRADIIFADPPYKFIDELAEPVFGLASMVAGSGDPLVVFEMPGGHTLAPTGWEECKRLGRGGGQQPSVALFRKRM